MNVLIIISGVICLLALVTTIIIGINPKDENYTNTTISKVVWLSVIYIVTFIPLTVFTLLYFVMR
ncbi:hypothetical protein LGQ02_01915 [Bacillus shivajii]|uniref:hypothetical protein n=1 Tax=Bacillus shivajii TaxID=1983719 RepID=UPI001CF95D35|nr:hypothetical protein [Bacillus shivajii]UCZ53578.1 hypothetical protein LGQ02_01915 [Bacillus shivajii]